MASIFGKLFQAIGLGIDDVVFGLLEPLKDALYDETVKGLSRVVKVHLALVYNFRNTLAGYLQSMGFPSPHPEYGSSPSGIVDAIATTLYATALTSAFLGEEVGEELWMEMIQEGISNAFQTSLGGTLQTYMNVFRGGLPPSVDDVTDMPQYWDMVDDKINALILASAGGNIYTTLHYLLRGIQNKLQQNYLNAINQLQILGTRLIEDYLWHINYYVELQRDILSSYIRRETMFVDYIVTYANDVVETAMSRINDYINELDTNYNSWKAGLINDSMFSGIISSIKNAYEQLKNEIENVITQLKNIVNDIDTSIPQTVIDNYKNALEMLSSIHSELVKKVGDSYYKDLENEINKVINLLQYVWAYRSFDQYREEMPENWQLPLAFKKTGMAELSVTVYGAGGE